MAAHAPEMRTPQDAELVSVLVRSMDRPSLERALDSAAAQTWPNVEIVVVAACGHSHRALPSEHRGRPLRLVFGASDRRLSRPEAANAALDAARGTWHNFLDDDDEFLPHHLETLMKAPRPLGERVVYSRTRVVDEAGNTLGHCGFEGFHATFHFQSRTNMIGTLFQRSLIDEGARFDGTFDLLEDHDFFINLATRTPFRFVNEASNVWHADAGASGSGFGSNERPEILAPYLQRLRSKWADALAGWTSTPEALLFLGQHHLRAGDVANALPFLEQALQLRPNDVNALNLCGMAYLEAGNAARAEHLIERALARVPGHAGLTANLALARGVRTRRH